MMKRKKHTKNFPLDLSDFIFSLTVRDVFNKNLLREKVKKIPSTFPSLGNYFGSYACPLLEEVRAQLYSSLELISQSPICKVLDLEEICGKPLFHIGIDLAEISSSLGKKELYMPKSGDIFAFSKAIPQSVTDLLQNGNSIILALVEVAADGEDSSTYDIQVKLSERMFHQKGRTESLFAVFLLNTITDTRIWKVLHPKGRRKRNQNIIKNLLGTRPLQVNRCDCSSEQNKETWEVKLGAYLQPIMLNASQVNATLMSLLVSHCPHNHGVELIWGPPGTGKTKTVSALLLVLFSMKCRTLACAPTNVAILELASRLVKLVKFFEGDLCSLSGILLLGSKDRMQIKGDLELIFLDYRVDRLTECFVMISGWNHQLAALATLLEDADSEYNMYLVLDKEKAEGKGHEGLSFSAFITRRFKAISDNLNNHLKDLIIHLPQNCFSKDSFKLMFKFQSLLSSFGCLLTNCYALQKEIREAFKGVEIDDPETNKLFETRLETLCIIKALQCNLKVPRLFGKDMIGALCMRSASLFLCTVSCSFKLYSGMIEPLQLLVIDEATQLKECESLIPLQLPGIQHAILIGDERQLPAVIKSKVAEKAHLGRSLYERLVSLGHMKHLLSIQYRMHPEISRFPNAKFYRSQILNAENVKHRDYKRHYLPGCMYGSYSFINVDCGKEVSENGRSKKNVVEVAVISQIVRNLFKASSKSEQRLSVGIISPYMAQALAIQKKIEKYSGEHSNIVVRVKCVDGFQGGEEDVIIMSTVRSNDTGIIGFLSDHRRTNVALTRARHCLWIVGCATTLTTSNSVWKEIVIDAQRRSRFFNAGEDVTLFKEIVHVFIELDQIATLFYSNSFLFNKAKCKVTFTDNFKKSFTRLKRPQTKKAVVDLLVKLSRGWHFQKGKSHPVDKNNIEHLKQCDVQGQHLFWTVEIMKEKTCTQVLKIWDILSSADVPKFIGHFEGIFSKYSENYMLSCKFKHTQRGMVIPRSWDNCPGISHLEDANGNAEGEDVCVNLASLSLEDKLESARGDTLQDHFVSSSMLKAR